jgi:hypothetical protein
MSKQPSQVERQLIEDLMHNASVSGGKPLEQRLADTALWFHMNKDRIPTDNLPKRLEFMEVGFWCLLEINALLLERIRTQTGSKTLFLPAGMRHANGQHFE